MSKRKLTVVVERRDWVTPAGLFSPSLAKVPETRRERVSLYGASDPRYRMDVWTPGIGMHCDTSATVPAKSGDRVGLWLSDKGLAARGAN